MTARVVIVGGGFGGLYAAKALRYTPVEVVLLDRRNFHLFQPLLYQVATGALSPGDIASPLRAVLRRQRNAHVWLAEVTDIDPVARRITMADGSLDYDFLIVATGARHSYFNHPEWEQQAPGLKTVEDATAIRHRIFAAFEAAERERNPARRSVWLTFVIVGAGPTGVELAGALAEIANETLRWDFRSIDPRAARIVLLEGTERVLPLYPPGLSARAQRCLERLGVTVRTLCLVTGIDAEGVTLMTPGGVERIDARTVIWAAGVHASPLGRLIAERTGAQLDRVGRVIVQPDCSVANYAELFVIGDLACFRDEKGIPLPGVAPVAMQQGKYVARLIGRRLAGEKMPPFRYFDRGTMAVIGRGAAVAKIGRLEIGGFPAWFLWLFVHLMYLVEFENRLLVLMQWAWNYITWNRGARLITGERS